MIRTSIKTKIKMTRIETVSVEVQSGLPRTRPQRADGGKEQNREILLPVLPAKDTIESERE